MSTVLLLYLPVKYLFLLKKTNRKWTKFRKMWFVLGEGYTL